MPIPLRWPMSGRVKYAQYLDGIVANPIGQKYREDLKDKFSCSGIRPGFPKLVARPAQRTVTQMVD